MKLFSALLVLTACLFLSPIAFSQSDSEAELMELYRAERNASGISRNLRKLPNGRRVTRLRIIGDNTLCIEEMQKVQEGTSYLRFTNPTGYYAGSKERTWVVPRDLVKEQPNTNSILYIVRAPYKNPVRRFSY